MTELQNKISTVFVGQKNFYTEFLVEWLSQMTILKGVVWTASNRHNISYNLHRLKKRIKRFGFFQTFSEILYYICNRTYSHSDEKALKVLINRARKNYSTSPIRVQTLSVPNLRYNNVTDFIKQCDCDVILSMCINEMIPESVFSLAKIGCFVYHEGIVPKYRGKFCTHWAILQRDYSEIGASLIKINRGLDTGKIAFVEHVFPEGIGRRHRWWEHEILYLALPRLKKWIEDVSAGRIELIDQKGLYPICSYPRFSHLFKIGKRVREYRHWLQEK